MSANKLIKYKTIYISTMGEPGQPEEVFDRFWFTFGVRTLHVFCYTVPFFIFATCWRQFAVHHFDAGRVLIFTAGVFVLHWITDCRRWASDKPWCAKPIMVDQTLHILQLAALGLLLV